MRPFEPQRLRAALPPWGQDAPPAADVAAYLAFHQLDDCAKGNGRSHRMGWLAVDGERIAAQAFVPPSPKGTAIARQGAEGFGETLLLAPLVRPACWPLTQAVWQIARRTINECPRTFRKVAENADFLRLLKRDPRQAKVLPVQWVTAMVEWMRRFERHAPMPQVRPHVIQGTADRTVGWRHNLRVLERLFSPRILRLPGARHHLVNEAPAVREAMWRWLDEHCAWGVPEASRERRSSAERRPRG